MFESNAWTWYAETDSLARLYSIALAARADKVQDVFVLYDASNSPVFLVMLQAEEWWSQW